MLLSPSHQSFTYSFQLSLTKAAKHIKMSSVWNLSYLRKENPLHIVHRILLQCTIPRSKPIGDFQNVQILKDWLNTIENNWWAIEHTQILILSRGYGQAFILVILSWNLTNGEQNIWEAELRHKIWEEELRRCPAQSLAPSFPPAPCEQKLVSTNEEISLGKCESLPSVGPIWFSSNIST